MTKYAAAADIDVPLMPAESARLGQAHQLMRAGDPGAALRLIDAVLASKPGQADALHLKGLVFASARRPDEGVRWLLQAARNRPNAANILCALGQTAYEAGMLKLARDTFRKVTELTPGDATVWHWRGLVAQAEQDFVEAVAAFKRATSLNPQGRNAWVNLGSANKRIGRIDDARAALAIAAQMGPPMPEILDVEAAMTAEQGDVEAAAKLYERLTSTFPGYVPGHDSQAKLLWENVPDRRPEESLLAAIRQMPEHLGLRISLIRLLIAMKRWDEAAAAVAATRRFADVPQLLAAEAGIAQGTGDDRASLHSYEAAIRQMPRDRHLRGLLARQLLKLREVERAARVVEETIAFAPDDQLAWAYLGTCWRLQDDPREFWLMDYDRLIATADLPDVTGLLAEVKPALEALHRGVRQPLDQTVRNGTQTPGFLFSDDTPALLRLRDVLMAAANAHVAALPDDPNHPFLRRKSHRVRFYGAWSVRLQGSGFHVNHVHPEGWLSSAFYVEVPGEMGAEDPHAGWIRFGMPQDDLGLDLPPRRLIEPKPGRLALFPSYLWHGTVPFQSVAPRMTAVFDALPD